MDDFDKKNVGLTNSELRVSKIKEGTVIDHITGGYAFEVTKILRITGKEKATITIAMNVPSKQLRVKDILKIEGRILNSDEVNKIALIAPYATINIIKDFAVLNKLEVVLPDIVQNIVKCPNFRCISNSNEPIVTKFCVENKEPLLLKCHYCRCLIEEADILQQL